MLRKLNTTLALIAVAGAVFCGAVFAFTHVSDIKDSTIVKQLGGE